MSNSQLPDLSDILSNGWGPTDDSTPSFGGLPFAPFSKRDPIDYVANWDASSSSRQRSRGGNRVQFGADVNTAQLGVFSDEEVEDAFEGGITVNKKKYDTIAKYRRDRTQQIKKLNYSQSKQVIREQQQLQHAPTSRVTTRRQMQNKRRRKKYIENPRPTVPSIKKHDAWIDITDIWFRETFEQHNNKQFLFKIDGQDEPSVPTPRSKKLILAGTLHGVLTKFDAQSGNTYKSAPLDYENYSEFKFIHFNYKAACQDPYILELANKNKSTATDSKTNVTIYTTENVMAAIMCCVRSKYSFDIVINKIGDKIFLDERSRNLSLESVDETSQNRPTKKGTSKINQYTALAAEATWINHVFKEQLVHHRLEYTQRLKRSHPFANEMQGAGGKKGRKNNKGAASSAQVASAAFIYNQYEVTDNMSIVCRCSVDGFIVDAHGRRTKNKDWTRLFALNQYDSTKSKTQNWKKYLDSKDATIISQEITNNNFKCARWGMQAHLADAKYIKLGFVSRVNEHDPNKHEIVGVRTYETGDFIRNKLRMRSTNEAWTILAKFVKSIQELEGDGRFIAVRDPLKQVIRLFRVSDDAFTKDDGLPSFVALKKAL
mmetsp:Transcript_56284/g.89653  ORF Transcript_56284/g.89653 Transcript_56284/m.89653 type:complete len:601 (+) Transcript_56284:55-1857(+)|eukprot:CAMPEP_0197043306 /NCGR_PEP_ID=MMETSP1384-20130603/19566_1 /TAXON_ID=29189 /ORGANISM="Ammonia sp." /LENGTH=600 /DNA_ID=CAMNT_0042474581 /DNA_START=36 /DNA_END=1838 /DNA_ORIENTATION=+